MLLAFSSIACVIREPETKPDLTQTGKEMFLQAESEVINLLTLFDNALKINSYKNTPDLLKEEKRELYFPLYIIKHKYPNIWYVCAQTDTLCTIVTDSNSIHTNGAVWQIKTRFSKNYYQLKCNEFNNWQISSSKINYVSWICTDSLDLTCTNLKAPLSFEKAGFTIKGKGEMNSDRGEDILLKYEIIKPLEHDSTVWMFKAGSLDLSATEILNNRTKTAIAEYKNALVKNRSVQIIYDDRTKLYENLDCNFYFINYY